MGTMKMKQLGDLARTASGPNRRIVFFGIEYCGKKSPSHNSHGHRQQLPYAHHGLISNPLAYLS